MKQTREIPDSEYDALVDKVLGNHRGTYMRNMIIMVTDDFIPTQCMAEVRYIAIDSAYFSALIQVDNAGTAVLLLRKEG